MSVTRVREAQRNAWARADDQRRALSALVDCAEWLDLAVERGCDTPAGRYYVGIAYCAARLAWELDARAFDAREAAHGLRRVATPESVAAACETVATVAERIARRG